MGAAGEWDVEGRIRRIVAGNSNHRPSGAGATGSESHFERHALSGPKMTAGKWCDRKIIGVDAAANDGDPRKRGASGIGNGEDPLGCASTLLR